MANDVCMLDDPTWAPRKGVYLYRPAGADWAATSGPWTMHSYHVTNVDPNGNPPLSEQDHWAVPDLNGFRESEPGPVAPQNAPDLTVALAADLAQCPTVVETTTPAPPADEPANYFAIVDPGESLGECFEANNGALLFAAACPP